MVAKTIINNLHLCILQKIERIPGEDGEEKYKITEVPVVIKPLTNRFSQSARMIIDLTAGTVIKYDGNKIGKEVEDIADEYVATYRNEIKKFLEKFDKPH